MAVVFGLGNPGPRYAATRHNVGRWVLDRLVVRWGAVPTEAVPEYRAWAACPAGREVELVAPLTFMNRSGEALDAWRERHGLDPGTSLVVVDDVYLPVGTIRIRLRGSSGGHQGLESIEAALPGRDYARLRVGVGQADSGAVLREHVLEEFDEQERAEIELAVERAVEAVDCWLTEGSAAAMNRFNRRVPKEVSEP